jgi:hypothetical protein
MCTKNKKSFTHKNFMNLRNFSKTYKIFMGKTFFIFCTHLFPFIYEFFVHLLLIYIIIYININI